MITKYRAIGKTIYKEELSRETEKSVFFSNGLQSRKRGNWYLYTDSFDEAKQFLLDRNMAQIKEASNCLGELQLERKEINDIQRF